MTRYASNLTVTHINAHLTEVSPPLQCDGCERKTLYLRVQPDDTWLCDECDMKTVEE